MINYNKKEAGLRLTQIIEQSGLNSRQFALHIGGDPSYLAKMEKGLKGISPAYIKKIEEKFFVRGHWILFGEGEKNFGQKVPHEIKTTPKTNRLGEETNQLSGVDPMIIIASLTNSLQDLTESNKNLVKTNEFLVRRFGPNSSGTG